MSASQGVPPVPAVLRLVQTAVLGRWRATGEELFREVARLTEAGPGKDLLVVGCGDGVTTEWLATRTGAHVTGVDADEERVERAELRARASLGGAGVSYQQAPLDDLPYESNVFDIVVGEPPLAAAGDPARAVRELARVAKPMAPVVLLQPTWSGDIAAGSRELVAERLGLRPFMVMQWKQMLRDAGVVEIQVQDWTSSGPAARGTGSHRAMTPPQLTLQQKMQIVGRAWRRWGWREARGAVERETTLLRELTRERAIGFQLLSGVKWPHAREAAAS